MFAKKNKKTKRKTMWEQHKDIACCFEQILKAAPYKTAAVQPLMSDFSKHPNKTNKTCWALLEK